jgi:glycosyltransferase involved in cell wall biosynthesis
VKPLVSILIPCYNADQWLADTVKSALAQTWDNTEIIVVDDGSTDGSLAIAQSFEAANLKVISQPNQGASAARNRALRTAQGDFIQYLDADDLLARDKIERQIELLLKHQNCIAAGAWARFYRSIDEATFKPEPVWQEMLPVDWLICSWEGGGMMHPAAWLAPRAIVEAAGLWNENLSLNDDGEYFSRVILASHQIKFCAGARSYYRSGISGSLSGTTSAAGLESAFQSLELCTSYLLNQENNPRTRHACATALQRFIYATYPDATNLVQKAEKKVHHLGGSDLQPTGGTVFQILANTVGWKQAKQFQRRFSRSKQCRA